MHRLHLWQIMQVITHPTPSQGQPQNGPDAPTPTSDLGVAVVGMPGVPQGGH